MTCEPASTPSSGNPYADLGMADAELRVAKAQAALRVTAVLREQSLTQYELAEKLGIDQSQLTHITRGQLKDFSLERLTQLADALAEMDLPAPALHRNIA
ncbi:MAG: helix-turn-helix transcriptional regulator [Thermomicrobiales bacterium]